ncbi:hypothetical protein [Bifidobacterium sp. ESL0819]|uniref:hypothetical protein n=1 Tax=Bifidobacterium sp. ESL0819 TaxID=3448589 RepID=UPI0040413EDE
MKTIILADECAEELLLSGWHHPNQRWATGIDISGDEEHHVQHERHEPQDMEPSTRWLK